MAHLVEKTVSGIGSLKLTYGSNLDRLGIGSTALYGPNFPFKRSQSRVSCNIRMQSFQPSHNALHIKKHEAVMDYTDDFIWCCRNISTSDGIRVFAGAVDDIVGAAGIRVFAGAVDDIVGAPGIRAASMGSRPDNTAMFSGAKRSKPYNATVAILEAGTEVKWCSSNISSTHDHAAIALDGAAVYRGKGKTLQKYRCRGPDLIVDDATLLIHEGVKAEEEFPNTGKLPDPESTTNLEFQKVDPSRYYGMKERLVGVSGETTTIVKRFNQMQDSGTLPFPAINVNGPFTKIKFDNLHGCRPSLPDGLMEAKDFMIAGKVAVGCGYGDVGKPFCAVQPLMEALPEDVFHTADIFVTTTSNKYIIMVDHMRKMKNNAIVCNIDLGEGPLMNLGCAYTGHPSFVMFCSFTKKAAYINVTAEGPYNTEEK